MIATRGSFSTAITPDPAHVIKVNAKIDEAKDTWTDLGTGLMWQEPPAKRKMTWSDAMKYCENLVLAGHDDWRLPAISELRSLIRGCNGPEKCGNLSVSNKECKPCDHNQGPGPNGWYMPGSLHKGPETMYWSSLSVIGYSDYAWALIFNSGHVYGYVKEFIHATRCVRGP